ncbi:Spermidine/putrescine import ATP-binding protein PotA [Roseivivax jejudonensis]|uniref:Spermidine/putrescine import ATP-binding protein PotA n=1 Tax=Roseivivax jejudonensis TaxID=1529041 RepID=A0A1X7A4W8_9RHOB|nr:ABC transporter ATP-binding protein [Roseivivax jejudonensis]SLN70745.1 Spermidine/putrescine import ATP-binding protein PotA [Roseivivax jejudonensis]
MSDPFLELDALTLTYGDTIAVEALDFHMAAGELVALLGPSGCGKTTTMRAIAGLMRPAAGHIRLDGRDITRVAPNRRGVGLVFQSYALFPHLSVYENVAFGLRIARIRAEELERRTHAALGAVGLTDFAGRAPAELSGGQQQRVALARSIVMEPKLLLLDEPLSNLDARLRLEMRTELARLQREFGIAMLYVTHDQAEALALADRIIVMNDGKVEQVGTPEDIYDRPTSVFVADFVGFENTFRVERGALSGANGPVDAGFAVTEGARGLAWRPQDVTLGQGPHRGRIEGASYLGQSVEYLMSSPLGPIKAERPAHEKRHATGTEVTFDLPQARAVELARG